MPRSYRPDALPSGSPRGYSSRSYDYVYPERRYRSSSRPPYSPSASASASYSYRVVYASQGSSRGTPHASRGRSSYTAREVADDWEYLYSRRERRGGDGDAGAYVRPSLVPRHGPSSTSEYYADSEGSGSYSWSSQDEDKSPPPRYGGYSPTTSSFPWPSRRGHKHSYDERDPAPPKRAGHQKHKSGTRSSGQEVPKRSSSRRRPAGSRGSPDLMEEEMERLRRRLDLLERDEEQRPRRQRRRERDTESAYGRGGTMREVKPWERPKYEWQYSYTEGPDGERLD
ncbi:uncharacterized protein E0L32_001194 [Thyridium curvatum]|uniref:Uncharacterized protein n=1 Tax=Thyridium curvatum TaxID=1093900 RepID=A0A507AXA5_9PEZI|nr:uncharacterized protein E0L32_001194 [Thyridium curvatum]TPX11376.1 hypothetical protein E0L32_001194 [Thyridium curvatum]